MMHAFWLLVLPAALLAAPASAEITDAQRLEVYREFRALFDARRYEEALPLAEKLVEMTEEQYGSNARALVNPLANVGTTYYRLGNYPAAEQHYLRSVEILESIGSTADRQLVRPLHGLGATYVATGQYEQAGIVLRRAVDLSRNLDGLFNVGQLEMLDLLITCYATLGLQADAEKEHLYAVRIAENAYGRRDPRMLGPLDRYASWLESVRRYTSARAIYARALSIAEEIGGQGGTLAVNPLLGIARTYRLEFTNGPEEVVVDQSDAFGPTRGAIPDIADSQRLNPDGERALQMALEALEKAEPVDHARLGQALVELGDWYLTGNSLTKAMDAYRRAWKELSLGGSTEILEAPRMLAYRPPTSSVTRSRLDPAEAQERFVEVSFTVTTTGRTANVQVVGGNGTESQRRAVVNAVRKARYAPRLADGEAVETTDVRLTERLLSRE